MKKYNILKANKDFSFISDTSSNTKGSREKRIVIDKKTKEKAYFKYEKYNCSEVCSEKLCYEIAKILGYNCAKIEIGKDENNKIGILNYLFINIATEEHDDAVSYINKDFSKRSEYYNINNIKKCLDKINTNLFNDFLKIMVFDALVGETDRHEENWGITKNGTDYKLSPLYDNACNLLREFKDENFAKKYYTNEKDFNSYILKASSIIYNEDGKRFKLFDLIKYLYKKYPSIVKKEIENLIKLKDKKIEDTVDKLPDELLTSNHKLYIITYLKTRRDILINIIKGCDEYDK